jgi:hypothetical protein
MGLLKAFAWPGITLFPGSAAKLSIFVCCACCMDISVYGLLLLPIARPTGEERNHDQTSHHHQNRKCNISGDCSCQGQEHDENKDGSIEHMKTSFLKPT